MVKVCLQVCIYIIQRLVLTICGSNYHKDKASLTSGWNMRACAHTTHKVHHQNMTFTSAQNLYLAYCRQWWHAKSPRSRLTGSNPQNSDMYRTASGVVRGTAGFTWWNAAAWKSTSFSIMRNTCNVDAVHAFLPLNAPSSCTWFRARIAFHKGTSYRMNETTCHVQLQHEVKNEERQEHAHIPSVVWWHTQRDRAWIETNPSLTRSTSFLLYKYWTLPFHAVTIFECWTSWSPTDISIPQSSLPLSYGSCTCCGSSFPRSPFLS